MCVWIDFSDRTVFLANLEYEVTEEKIHGMFAPVGEIANINIKRNEETGASKGFGSVEFKTKDAAQKALKNE